jgi:allantoin racemase
MTEKIGECARSVAAVGTMIDAVSPSMGPASIESHYDEALSVPGVLEEIARGERAGVDGYVLACFGDPGLDAARELASGPVVAIAEAGMKVATYLGRGFTVVTTLGRTMGRAWDLAAHYGVKEQCRGVRACEIAVLDLDVPGSAARDVITAECARAVAEDGCDVIVLGCAGMADLAADISSRIGIPVVDGVAAATTMVQALVTMGLKTSTRSEFAAPIPKDVSGLLKDFALT